MNQFGVPQPLVTSALALWWYALSIPESGDLDSALADVHPTHSAGADRPGASALRAPGVYVFEGCHDSRPTGGILYIGQVGADCENDDRPGRSVLDRGRESFSRFVWKETRVRGAAGVGLFADVWNLRMRWAHVHTESIRAVERLLIRAHAPSFNSQNVRSKLPAECADLLVLNGGAKGMLLPVVSGKYFDAAFWDMLEEPMT